jgi:hypothetical protein
VVLAFLPDGVTLTQFAPPREPEIKNTCVSSGNQTSNTMNTRNLFAYVLSGLVLLITIMALLGVWNIINWENLEYFFGKTIQSLVIIVVSAVVIYLIQALLLKKDTSQENQRSVS